MAPSLDLRPLTPAIGAEIRGIDLTTDLDDPAVEAAVRAAFLEHHVLVFRDQELTREAHKSFGRRFGELHVHPSNKRPNFTGDPEIFRVKSDENTVLNNGGLWHADVTCELRPPLGSMLLLTEAPSHGGDTLFANMHLAYETLSEPIRDLLDGLHAVHDQALDYARYGIEIPADTTLPRSTHPVVVRHPETGRRLLFVNRAFTDHIVELRRPESDALLSMLYDHIAGSPSLQCRVQWQPGTLVFWDNRCTQHYAVWDYRPQRRAGERVTIMADTAPAA